MGSPDGEHLALLEIVGELRFGPRFFSLKVNDLFFGGRIFGEHYLWSGDSRFFAIQEWKTSDQAGVPVTELLLIDVAGKRECPLSGATGGWIAPKRFEDGKLVYTKTFHDGGGRIVEYEIEFLGLERWKPLVPPTHAESSEGTRG